MLLGKPNAFERDSLVYTVGIDAGIVQHNHPTQRVAYEANRELANNVEQRGEIEDVLGDAVHGSGSPCAVAVSAQIERIDVVVLTKRARYPIPVTSVVQPAMHQHQSGLVVLAIVPELELEPVGIEKM